MRGGGGGRLLCAPVFSRLMMIDRRLMGQSCCVGGDSSALHHCLSELSLLPVTGVSARPSDQLTSLKAPLYAGRQTMCQMLTVTLMAAYCAGQLLKAAETLGLLQATGSGLRSDQHTSP